MIVDGLSCSISGNKESNLPIFKCTMLHKKSLKQLAIDSTVVIVPLSVCNCKHDDEFRFDGKNFFIRDHMSFGQLVRWSIASFTNSRFAFLTLRVTPFLLAL